MLNANEAKNLTDLQIENICKYELKKVEDWIKQTISQGKYYKEMKLLDIDIREYLLRKGYKIEYIFRGETEKIILRW